MNRYTYSTTQRPPIHWMGIGSKVKFDPNYGTSPLPPSMARDRGVILEDHDNLCWYVQWNGQSERQTFEFKDRIIHDIE